MYRFFFDESKIVAVGSENIAHDSGGLGINFRIGLKDLAQTSILRRLNWDALKSVMFSYIVHSDSRYLKA
jgi:hypothetical protein